MAGITNHVETIYEFKETGHASLMNQAKGLTGVLEKSRALLPGFTSELGAIPGMFGGILAGAGSAIGVLGGLSAAVAGYGALVFKLTADHDALRREMGASISAAYSFKGAHTPLEQYRMSLEASGEQMHRFSGMQASTGATTLELSKTFGMLVSAADRSGKSIGDIEKATVISTKAAKAMGMGMEEVNLGLLTLMETGMARGEFSKRLGLVGKDMTNLSQAQRWDVAMNAMKRWGVAGEEAAKRPAVQLRVMMSTLDELFVESSRPAFNAINDGISRFVELIRENRAGIGSFFKTMADSAAEAARWVVYLAQQVDKLGKIWAVTADTQRTVQDTANRQQMHKIEGMYPGVSPSAIIAAAGGVKADLEMMKSHGTGFLERTFAKTRAEDYARLSQAVADNRQQSVVERTQGALGAAVVNNTTNIGQVVMNNDFKDVEPDRILLAIRDELESAGENRTQARTAPAHASP